MSVLQETYTLSNGVTIPKLGLGTWFINQKDAPRAVRDAVSQGYRLVDTAEAYMNEAGVAEGVRTCGAPRDEVFVTSKVVAEAKTYGDAMAAIDGSLAKMGMDHIDMMIIHSPQPWKDWRKDSKRYFEENVEAWRALEDAYKAGKLRAIGVSNFLADDLDNILGHCTIRPMVNQILCHVSNTPVDLIAKCQAEGILVEAYAPIAHGKVLKDKKICAMARKYGVSVPQLCIRYCLQLGCVALSKTANPGHMRQNADVDFTITEVDMQALKAFDRIKGYGFLMGMMPVFSGK